MRDQLLYSLCKKLAYIFIFLAFIPFSTYSAEKSAKSYTYCNVHWPPWIIIENNQFSGIDVEILKAVADKSGLHIKFLNIPWKRCLSMIKQGKADFTSSVIKTDERAAFMAFLEPAIEDTNDLAFYAYNDQFTILNYEDIIKYSIGTVAGYQYFTKFDTDDRINKHIIQDDLKLVKMLALERFDVAIGAEKPTDYILKQTGLKDVISKTPYKFTEPRKTFLALSKKSKLMEILPTLNNVLLELKKHGDVSRIKENYK